MDQLWSHPEDAMSAPNKCPWTHLSRNADIAAAIGHSRGILMHASPCRSFPFLQQCFLRRAPPRRHPPASSACLAASHARSSTAGLTACLRRSPTNTEPSHAPSTTPLARTQETQPGNDCPKPPKSDLVQMKLHSAW